MVRTAIVALIALQAATGADSRWFGLHKMPDGSSPYLDLTSMPGTRGQSAKIWLKMEPKDRRVQDHFLYRYDIRCDRRTVYTISTVTFYKNGGSSRKDAAPYEAELQAQAPAPETLGEYLLGLVCDKAD